MSVRNTFCNKTSLLSISEVNITWFVVFFNPHKPLRKNKQINGEGGTSAPSMFCCVMGDGISGLMQPENTYTCWLLLWWCLVCSCMVSARSPLGFTNLIPLACSDLFIITFLAILLLTQQNHHQGIKGVFFSNCT